MIPCGPSSDAFNKPASADDRANLAVVLTPWQRRGFFLHSLANVKEFVLYILLAQQEMSSPGRMKHAPYPSAESLVAQLQPDCIATDPYLIQALFDVRGGYPLDGIDNIALALRLGSEFTNKSCTSLSFTVRSILSFDRLELSY